jgi:hypothetical protein
MVMTEVQNGGLKDVLEIELEDRFHVTLHAIQFQRDQDRELVQILFEFHLHADDGYLPFPVSMTEWKDSHGDLYSLDDLYKNAFASLYTLLHSFAETTRRREGFQNVSFKN